jgi:hypothetical protein
MIPDIIVCAVVCGTGSRALDVAAVMRGGGVRQRCAVGG